ncbi:MAG: hypothetical protein JSU79_01585 [Dehalococcoidales bacterium]|nr:MAG: hypothetical protein JSU79_01585 [Dehalococcoidales bacterium]
MALSLGVSGIVQHNERQFPDSQQVVGVVSGDIGVMLQPSLSISDPATAATGAESSMITADINAINKALLIFIVIL